MRKTFSLCPECYKKIPAVIGQKDDMVLMGKICSEHGRFESVVENDADFYAKSMSMNGGIYNGYLLDVTKKCNMKCKYCYYGIENKSEDPTIDHILQEIATYRDFGPIIITGGEPTLRGDLPEIFKAAKCMGVPTALLTNGTRLTDELIDELVPNMMFKNNSDATTFINLSIHPESNGADLRVIESMRARMIKLESVLFVVESFDQIDRAIEFCLENNDVISSARLKLASKLWAEQKPKDELFVSDVWKHVKENHGAEVAWDMPNKARFFNIRVDGFHFMVVHWYDVNNIDILDKSCPPFYKAKNGMVDGLNITALINEGMSKGYIDGVKYAV